MDAEAMLDRAQRVVKTWADQGRKANAAVWAEALLAVEAARVEAVRERDELTFANGTLLDEMNRWKATGTDLIVRCSAAEARAEQAERALAEASTAALEEYDLTQKLGASLVRAEGRVAALEGALMDAHRLLYQDGANAAGEVKALIDAALEDQVAPTEPTIIPTPHGTGHGWDAGCRCDDCSRWWQVFHAAPQVAPTEPSELDEVHAVSFDRSPEVVGHALGLGGAEGDAREAECTGGEFVGSVRSVGGTGGEVVDRLHDSIVSRPSSDAVPQAAPEPERCPTCHSVMRDVAHDDCTTPEWHQR